MVNFSYEKKLLERPTRRHIFANTVGRICKLNLALRHWEVVIDPETNPCLIGSSDLVYKGH